MKAPNVDIFIVDPAEKTYLTECPKTISYFEFQNILVEKKIISILRGYYVKFKGKKYDKNCLDKVLNFENGDKVVIVNTREEEKFCVKLHTNPVLNESSMNKGKVTGILRLILLKYISTCINNVNLIPSEEIRYIVNELKQDMQLAESPEDDIKSNLTDKSGSDIIAFSKYIDYVINDQDIDNLLNLLGQNMQNSIIKFWSILAKYEEFNKRFQVDLFEAIKNSYFDYSLVNLSLFEQVDRMTYLDARSKCDNTVIKYLFHGTHIDPITKIITKGFLYTRKPFYGMGIYFTNMLDYVSFYCGGNDFDSRRDNFGKTIPVNSTFSCVSAEVFYDKSKKKEIYDYSLLVDELDHFPTYEEICKTYKEQMVPQDGVNFARVEPNQGQVRKKEDIIKDQREGKFIGTEYVITEKNQILPLYGLTFKRNEKFVLWRDPNFEGQNDFSGYLKERKLFIYKHAKMNAYFESSTEKALEIIKKKKFNKIILISSIGLDLSGKKFVEIARKILGFNVVVLFFSQNYSHFSWLQTFPNALYTDNEFFYKEYIENYDPNGLLNLKAKMESYYNIKLTFTNDFFEFPKFINQQEYDKIIFEEKCPNFKKVTIKCVDNNSIFCMNLNRTPFLSNSSLLDSNLSEWYVTMIENEITLFSNGSYLGADLNQRRAKGEQFMQRYNFEQINSDNEYIIYFGNKNYVLTANGNQTSLQQESLNRKNQRFKLIESSFSL